jgi:hypothetical protein
MGALAAVNATSFVSAEIRCDAAPTVPLDCPTHQKAKNTQCYKDAKPANALADSPSPCAGSCEPID